MRIDDLRLRLHFARVTLWLKANSCQRSGEKHEAREKQIAEIRRYAQQGIFPRNHTHKTMRPCFIDRDDRRCAVAHLLIQSGYEYTAKMIAARANDAYVPEMLFPELDIWAEQHGLTREELTVVQPAYPPTAEQVEAFFQVTTSVVTQVVGYLLTLGFFGVIGILSIVRTLHDWKRMRWGTLFPLLASLVGIVLAGFGLWLSSLTLDYTLIDATMAIIPNEEMQQSFDTAYDLVSLIKLIWQPVLIAGAIFFLFGNTLIFKNWLHRGHEKRV
jgi:hypothetical protein